MGTLSTKAVGADGKKDWRKRVKPLRRPVSRTAVALCVLGLFLSTVAWGLGFFGGVWVPLDAFSHLRIHFAGAAIGFLLAILALILFRRRRYGAIVLILAALGTVMFAGLWPKHAQPKYQMPALAANETALRLVSYNIWERNRDIDRLEEFLTNSDADIIVLLEFFDHHRSLLEMIKQKYPHQIDCSDVKNCNVAILSRNPIVKHGANVKWAGPVTLWAQFGEDLKGLTLFGVHFVRPDTPNRQWQQIKALAGQTFSATGPVIVAGDFNAAPGSLMLLGLQEFAGLWRLPSLPTWPSWFFGLPQLAIDQIFVSNGVRPLSYPQVGQNAGSDHLPLNAEIAISGQGQ